LIHEKLKALCCQRLEQVDLKLEMLLMLILLKQLLKFLHQDEGKIVDVLEKDTN
jgi:hypothetical protein